MYAGGLAVAEDFVRSVESLNYSGGTASDIMTLAQNTKSKTEGRLAHMSGDAAARNRVSPDELKKRYEAATRFTAGTVFGRGDGHLGEVVRDEVIRRNTAKINSDIASVEKKKKDLRDLRDAVLKIRVEKESPSFKMTCEKLKTLVKWKKRDGDKAIPSKKEDLEKRWRLTKDRQSPNVSPCNSDVEDEENESLEEEIEYESDK